MSDFVPPKVWPQAGAVNKPGMDSQVGCVKCLIVDNMMAPVDRVYYYKGTSYCMKHVREEFGVVVNLDIQ